MYYIYILLKVNDQKAITCELKKVTFSEFYRILNDIFPEILTNMNLW